MIDVTETLVHWLAERSQAEIASSLGVDRKTVRKYTAPPIAAGMAPGGPPLHEQQWAELVRGWFPELVDTRLRQSSWPAIEPHHDYIKDLLGQVTVSTVHQRLPDDYGLEVSLSSLRRYVTANLLEQAAASLVRTPMAAADEPLVPSADEAAFSGCASRAMARRSHEAALSRRSLWIRRLT